MIFLVFCTKCGCRYSTSGTEDYQDVGDGCPACCTGVELDEPSCPSCGHDEATIIDEELPDAC